MSPDIAHLVAIEAFRASACLGNLVPILKDHLPVDEYEILARSIAQCITEINVEVLNKVFVEHPDLKEQIERRVESYGRVF